MKQPSHCREPFEFSPERTGAFPGEECFIDLNGVKMLYGWCPPTSPEGFAMAGDKNEKVSRQILTSGFWLGKHHVTQAQWRAVMGSKPQCRFEGDELPVDSVSYDMVREFARQSLRWLPEGWALWLPTEAQWEWACRAGSTTAFAVGTGHSLTSQIANFDGNHPDGQGSFDWLYRETTVAAGSFPPNAWGLHDMHGQLWEWCQDWLADLPGVPPPNYAGPAQGSGRVLRGGSWINDGRFALSAFRGGSAPGRRDGIVGFRVCPISIQPSAGGRERSTVVREARDKRSSGTMNQ